LTDEKVQRLCKSSFHVVPVVKTHAKRLLEDGWTRYICQTCGQVKFMKPRSELRKRKAEA